MSIIYCHICDKHIDTDYEEEHECEEQIIKRSDEEK